MKNPKILFIQTHPDAQLPSQAHSGEGIGDTGYDLKCVADEITVPARSSNIIPVGLKVGFIEPGYWFKIEARSGLGFKHSVQPHQGVIDCVPKGTKISTLEGDIFVEKLFEKETDKFVYSYNEEKMTIEEDYISDMWIVPNKELLQIETEDGNIVKIPLEKEVYTKRGWVKAKDLVENDEILSIS